MRCICFYQFPRINGQNIGLPIAMALDVQRLLTVQVLVAQVNRQRAPEAGIREGMAEVFVVLDGSRLVPCVFQEEEGDRVSPGGGFDVDGNTARTPPIRACRRASCRPKRP